MDLPRRDGGELGYARTVAGYLTHDRNATAVLFAVYTATPWDADQPKPRAAIIAALTGVLAERGITISDGLLVGNQTFTQYDGDPQDQRRNPPDRDPDQRHQRRIHLPRQQRRRNRPDHAA
ncbi:hypothetical protein [Arthrobacter sp. ISL-28]|uniref:hypothetical protein n=1 Tax=Arthrobacter sp. ISL-28 TaxID=2819108 RepID=UPI0028896191|nr:hypothetical protein [Arthrobacter sp. ISL-28]